MVQNEDLMRKRGGQPGNANARKHGFYAQDGKRNWAEMDKMILECRKILKSIGTLELTTTYEGKINDQEKN